METKRRRNEAAYFLLLLTFVLAAASRPSLTALVFLPAVFLHGFTIDKVLPRVLSRKLTVREVLLLAVNAAPYVYFFTPLALIPATAFLLSIVLSYARSNVLPQLMGTVGISLLYLPLVQIFGGVRVIDLGVYLVWATYTLVEGIYVEYKLPYRRVTENQLRISWLSSLALNAISVAISPLLVLPLIEPTIRFMKPGEKLSSPAQIRELGRRGAKRTLLAFALLLAVILVYELQII